MNGPAVQITGFTKEFVDPRSKEKVRAVDGIDLEIADGEFFALLGPSGCGKTTTLRAIAGFEDPTSGTIRIAGRELQGVPPFHRPVNTVFQDYALFPHMTVLQNVLFGLRMARVRSAEAERRAREALEMVRLPEVAGRKPTQLSGGQKQRVALARALVNRPAVLLLDEPLGALDLKLRKAMQLELKELQGRVGITFVYVTHDQEEALTMADRIAVMSAGHVLQVGRPDEIYERPTDRFVADFIGESNFLEGRIVSKNGRDAVLERPGGRRLTGEVRDASLQVGDEATLAIRPEKLDVRPADQPVAPEEGGERVDGVVTEVHYLGTDTRYHVRIDEGGLVARIQNQHGGYDAARKVGEDVRVSWHHEHASLLR